LARLELPNHIQLHQPGIANHIQQCLPVKAGKDNHSLSAFFPAPQDELVTCLGFAGVKQQLPAAVNLLFAYACRQAKHCRYSLLFTSSVDYPRHYPQRPFNRLDNSYNDVIRLRIPPAVIDDKLNSVLADRQFNCGADAVGFVSIAVD
jgi:hypothetical protein